MGQRTWLNHSGRAPAACRGRSLPGSDWTFPRLRCPSTSPPLLFRCLSSRVSFPSVECAFVFVLTCPDATAFASFPIQPTKRQGFLRSISMPVETTHLQSPPRDFFDTRRPVLQRQPSITQTIKRWKQIEQNQIVTGGSLCVYVWLCVIIKYKLQGCIEILCNISSMSKRFLSLKFSKLHVCFWFKTLMSSAW